MTETSAPWDHLPSATAPVQQIDAWEALDSRGHPTTGCAVTLTGGFRGRALVPTGASVGQFEQPDLRDGDQRYAGLGVRKAVEAIHHFGRTHAGAAAAHLDAALEGPSNVTLAISIALAKAVASASGLTLWQALDRDGAASLPCPMVNIFSGGRHAEGSVRVQDFLVIPTEAESLAEALEIIWEVRRAAAGLVEQRHGTLLSRLVADEGGLAVVSDDDEEPLALLSQAIDLVGRPAAIALDIAATQLSEPEQFESTLIEWCDRYPIVSVEDPCDDDDWPGWQRVSERLGHLQLVGDDLFATNPTRIERAARDNVANTVLIKPNQIGTLRGAWHAIVTARLEGYSTVISARSGDTEDDALADLAVGWSGGQIKIGSVMRSERLAKFNRLLEIEAVDGLPYAGWRRR